MGWEFAARWIEDADAPWQWVWRRIADDSGEVIQESRAFTELDPCIQDAKNHGFDDDACGLG